MGGLGGEQTPRKVEKPDYSDFSTRIPNTRSLKIYLTQFVFGSLWLRGQDSNLQPLGYEPNELPIAPPRGTRDIKDSRERLIYMTYIRNRISRLVTVRRLFA